MSYLDDAEFVVLVRQSRADEDCHEHHWEPHGFSTEEDALDFIQNSDGTNRRIPLLRLQLTFAGERTKE